MTTPADSLTLLIVKALMLAKEIAVNDEFVLAYDGGSWCAEAGNPSNSVNLGESSGEFSAGGDTAEAAVQALIDNLRSGRRAAQ